VWVSRIAFQNITRGHELRTGLSPLYGPAVLGDTYTSESAGFQVELHAEEEVYARGERWPQVVERRLTEVLLPLLAPARLRLEVGLSVASHALWAQLEQRGYLGYERFQGGTHLGHRLVVFLGDTSESWRARPPEAPVMSMGMPLGEPPPGGRRDAA
jgi:hypothetical protein